VVPLAALRPPANRKGQGELEEAQGLPKGSAVIANERPSNICQHAKKCAMERYSSYLRNDRMATAVAVGCRRASVTGRNCLDAATWFAGGGRTSIRSAHYPSMK